MGAAFDFGSDQDYKDATKVVAEVDQAGLGLPDRDYYFKTDAKSERIRKQYVWHVAKTFGLLGDDPKTAAAEADTVMRLETELARVSMDRVSRRDPDNVYHRMDAAALAKLAPGFDWSLYMAKTGAPTPPWLNVVSTGFATGFSSLLGVAAAGRIGRPTCAGTSRPPPRAGCRATSSPRTSTSAGAS